jgi:FkbM family methyltransferase
MTTSTGLGQRARSARGAGAMRSFRMQAGRWVRKWRRTLFEMFGSDRYSHLALNDLDRKLEEYLDFEGGIFIEAGANDGLTQSNTYWFERFRNWRGILIEALPEKAAECRRNRPKARVFWNALVATDDTKSIRMKTANLMAYVVDGLDSSEERTHLSNAIRVQHLASIEEVDVPARTLSSILQEYGASKIDFFSLDVEGYEVEVLKGLHAEQHRPRFILVETKKIATVLDALQQRYRVRDQLSHHDYLLQEIV